MPDVDVIIAGAGSVGVPTAVALGAMGVKTLVLDANPSPGQGDNKHAIGGIRATHSDPGKILVSLRSLEIFSTWKECFGMISNGSRAAISSQYTGRRRRRR
jgi:sarcosine oxidase subunit beta